jgi:hypothetical protein
MRCLTRRRDQFPPWHAKFADKIGSGAIFKALLNVRSMETLVEWGEKLKRQHRAPDLLALPDFMTPKRMAATPAVSDAAPAKKLRCAQCGAKISYPEGKFCWNNSQRFNGLQYCRDHQGLF